jgi:NADPH:quinone reductase-like Zn-dependent oxidoreductase
MKAVVLTTYGEPATGLVYRDLPEPEKPGVAHVLVGVEFAPINFSDILVAADSIRCIRNCPLSSEMKAWDGF